MVERYAYSPYGAVTAYTGKGADGVWFTGDDVSATVSARGNSLTFQGRELDGETGNLYYRARYYQPTLGRFTSRDPLGFDADAINIFRFLMNGSFSALDPWGLEADIQGLQILGHYLYGGGEDMYIDGDPEWKAYMESSKWVSPNLKSEFKLLAKAMCKTKNGTTVSSAQRYHADLENGENMTGRNYLSGSNKNVGDFIVLFTATKEDGEGECCSVKMELEFNWNDKIDPNVRYRSDRWKDKVASAISGGNKMPYNIHITWHSTAVYRNQGGHESVQGWPLSGFNLSTNFGK